MKGQTVKGGPRASRAKPLAAREYVPPRGMSAAMERTRELTAAVADWSGGPPEMTASLVPKPPKLPTLYRRAHTARKMVDHPHGQWLSHAQHARAVVLLEMYIERLKSRLRVTQLDVECRNHLEREANQVREEGDPVTVRLAIDMQRART